MKKLTLTNKHKDCDYIHLDVEHSLSMAEISRHYFKAGYEYEQYASIPSVKLLANMTHEEILAAKFTPTQLERYLATGSPDYEPEDLLERGEAGTSGRTLDEIAGDNA